MHRGGGQPHSSSTDHRGQQRHPSTAPVHSNASATTAASAGAATSVDYLRGPPQSVQRRRIDPRVALATILQEICGELRASPNALHFLQPVNVRLVTDYAAIVKEPMDLSRIHKNILENRYETREAFLNDVRLMMDNSRLYNGDASEFTQAGRLLFEEATKHVLAREARMVRLEKCINPLLDDNDLVAFNYMLAQVVEACKAVPRSFPFHSAVDAKKFPTYATQIRTPMDLGRMALKSKQHKYTSVAAFVADLQLVHANCVAFNGEVSGYTAIAAQILQRGRDALQVGTGVMVGDLNRSKRRHWPTWMQRFSSRWPCRSASSSQAAVWPTTIHSCRIRRPPSTTCSTVSCARRRSMWMMNSRRRLTPSYSP